MQIISTVSPSRANPHRAPAHPLPYTRCHTRSPTMVFPPSEEAYEALVNEVKALKEEVKRLRNVRSPAEVEVQPKTIDRKAMRDSWADIYNEATALRKSRRLLGQKVETDDGLEWRVKWGQRGTGAFLLLVLICFVLRQIAATVIFCALTLYLLVYCITKTSRS